MIPICIECARRAKRVTGVEIYPHRPDLAEKLFWLCQCGAYCGSHSKSGLPLGYPAGPETREARSKAHAAFDPIWKMGGIARKDAYAWLSAAMGIHPDLCHISMMNKDAAMRVVEVCKARYAGDGK